MIKLFDFFYKMLNKIGIKRLPPIMAPITIPLALIIMVIYAIFRFSVWLLGFWKCHKCGKYYWIIHDRKVIGRDDDVIKAKECVVCQVEKELSAS